MTCVENPWAKRFEPILQADEIRRRAAVRVEPLVGLYDLPTEVACARLSASLKETFYPTQQCVDILLRLAQASYAHCISAYPSEKAFLGGVYNPDSLSSDEVHGICLTGLGGIGKSKLLEAFSRIQAPDQVITVDKNHSTFKLRSTWRTTVRARSSAIDVLSSLAGEPDSLAALVKQCRRVAFKNGIAMLMVDELQFATGSSDANTRVAQILMSVGYIGIPYIFSANFSLLRRLSKRPGEEQERLLSDPIVLLPDDCSSNDWKDTLRELRKVAPDVLCFDPVEDAKELHSMTSGRLRAARNLFVIALRMEHQRCGYVDISAIRRAFESPAFSRYREELSVLLSQTIRGRPDRSRMDLWCPIPLPKTVASATLERAIASREELVAEEELKSALTKSERTLAREIARSASKSKERSATVVRLRKSSQLTKEELLKNTAFFHEHCTK